MKPKGIQESIFKDNKAHLIAAGRKSAEKLKEKREEDELLREIIAEEKMLEESALKRSTNEDVVPFNEDDQN